MSALLVGFSSESPARSPWSCCSAGNRASVVLPRWHMALSPPRSRQQLESLRPMSSAGFRNPSVSSSFLDAVARTDFEGLFKQRRVDLVFSANSFEPTGLFIRRCYTQSTAPRVAWKNKCKESSVALNAHRTAFWERGPAPR